MKELTLPRKDNEAPAPENRYQSEARQIRVIRSVREIEQIRPAWEAMQVHPNADIDFYLTVVFTRPDVLRPHIIVLESGGRPQAMLIGRIEKIPLECRLGYKILARPIVRALTIVHGGALGDTTHPNASALIDELYASLKRGEADLAQLSSLDSDSDLCLYARRKPNLLCRDYLRTANPHWQLSLPRSLEELVARIKSKHRYWMRRMERLLERDHPGRVSFRVFRDEAAVDQLCRDTEKVAALTYQRGIGVGFANGLETRRRLSLAAAEGWLRAYLIYLDREPCAFWIGTLYGRMFYLDYTGFDPQLNKYEPGTILFMKMIEDLCQDGVDKLDYGFGDAFYKERFGEEKWNESTVLMFAPTCKGIRHNLLWTATVGSSAAAGALVRRLGLERKIKKLWRARATPPADEAARQP